MARASHRGRRALLAVFTPLAYGTVEPWSEAVAELVVLAMALVYLIGQGLRDWEIRFELPLGWLPAVLFLGLIAFQAIAPMSVDPHTTRREALRLLTIAAFFLICWNTYRTRAQVMRAVWTMIAMGTVLAIFGIVQRVTWNGHLYWIGPEITNGSPFGPFVNRAHFAGLMVVVVPMALAPCWPGGRGGSRCAAGADLARQGPGLGRRGGERGQPRALPRARHGRCRAREWLALAVCSPAGRAAGHGRWSVASGHSWVGRTVRVGLSRCCHRVGRRLDRRATCSMGPSSASAPSSAATESPRLVDLGQRHVALVRGPRAGHRPGYLRCRLPARPDHRGGRHVHACGERLVQLLTDTGMLGLALALAALVSVSFMLLQRLRRRRAGRGGCSLWRGWWCWSGLPCRAWEITTLLVMSNFIYLALAVVLAVNGHDAPVTALSLTITQMTATSGTAANRTGCMAPDAAFQIRGTVATT